MSKEPPPEVWPDASDRMITKPAFTIDSMGQVWASVPNPDINEPAIHVLCGRGETIDQAQALRQVAKVAFHVGESYGTKCIEIEASRASQGAEAELEKIVNKPEDHKDGRGIW